MDWSHPQEPGWLHSKDGTQWSGIHAQGKRRRGRPRQSWRRMRTRMAELDEQGTTWAAAKKIAQNRTLWKVTVNGFY